MSERSEILELFEQRDSPAVLRKLVDEYDGLATRLARRYRGRGEAIDDLEQVARVGLLKAVERFDAAHGVKFATFATRTIIGELKRHLRDKSWAIRVPRSLQERWLESSRAIEDLTHALGRSPTIDEIGAHIGASREEVLEAMDAGSAYTATSLDAPVGDEDGGTSRIDLIGEDDPALQVAGPWAAVVGFINELPARERAIVRMRFFDDMSQSEIGEALGISQMHVSRLLRQSLQRIRTQAGPDSL